MIDVAESLNEAVSEEEAHVNRSRHDAADRTYRFSDNVGGHSRVTPERNQLVQNINMTFVTRSF